MVSGSLGIDSSVLRESRELESGVGIVMCDFSREGLARFLPGFFMGDRVKIEDSDLRGEDSISMAAPPSRVPPRALSSIRDAAAWATLGWMRPDEEDLLLRRGPMRNLLFEVL